MLRSGDVVDLELGTPRGAEAAFLRPAVVVTAQRVLDLIPTVVHVVPLTSTIRSYQSEVVVEPDPTTGLGVVSAGQCQHLRAVSPRCIAGVGGNVGPSVLAQLRETTATILELP